MHSDGYCLDINECQQDAECSQICTNTEGSYKCSCRDGYVLESNNFCRAQGIVMSFVELVLGPDIQKIELEIVIILIFHL